ncbi:hypothetical protein LINPERHAP2_LOCUS6710 [Linum perenne]
MYTLGYLSCTIGSLRTPTAISWNG